MICVVVEAVVAAEDLVVAEDLVAAEDLVVAVSDVEAVAVVEAVEAVAAASVLAVSALVWALAVLASVLFSRFGVSEKNSYFMKRKCPLHEHVPQEALSFWLIIMDK